MKGICILGATGSIGVSTLDVVARHPDQYKVVALTANGNIDALFEQCLAHRPEYAVVANPDNVQAFTDKLAGTPIADIKVLAGADAWLRSRRWITWTPSWPPLSALPVCCRLWLRRKPVKRCC